MTMVTPQLKVSHSVGITRTAVQQRMLRAIVWYQQLRQGVLSPCRFFPSCSSYAYEAIDQHGAWRGGVLTAKRLCRCRPFGPSGYDPVPLCCNESEAAGV